MVFLGESSQFFQTLLGFQHLQLRVHDCLQLRPGGWKHRRRRRHCHHRRRRRRGEGMRTKWPLFAKDVEEIYEKLGINTTYIYIYIYFNCTVKNLRPDEEM